jgi:hypothetical protein
MSGVLACEAVAFGCTSAKQIDANPLVVAILAAAVAGFSNAGVAIICPGFD